MRFGKKIGVCLILLHDGYEDVMRIIGMLYTDNCTGVSVGLPKELCKKCYIKAPM